MESSGLWKTVIQAKYGVANNWCTKQGRAPHGSGPWKHISKLWGEFKLKSSLKLGNGGHISFWKDKWLGTETLKDEFPALFLLASNKDATISHVWQNSAWAPHFRRDIEDWELNDLLVFAQ